MRNPQLLAQLSGGSADRAAIRLARSIVGSAVATVGATGEMAGKVVEMAMGANSAVLGALRTPRTPFNKKVTRQTIDMRSANPIVRSFSGVLKFQLDGAGQEGSGSTEEEQDEQEVDGSDQGGSRPCQGNRMEEID